MTVRFTLAARADLLEAQAWYEMQSSGLGEEFVEAVLLGLDRIEALPNAWQQIGRSYRRYRLARFPYGIAYQVHDGVIIVIAIGHLRRRPAYWRKRLTKDRT